MKKHKILSILSSFFLLAFLAAGCSEDTPVSEPQNIVEIAVGNSEFSTLVSALSRVGLVDVLKGDGPFTVFAPTNNAFSALLTDLGISSLDQVSNETLTSILLNHVVSGKFESTDLSTGYVATANTNGPNSTAIDILISTSSGVKINGNINVTNADIQASNGIIHVVDRVILPTDVVDKAIANTSFTSLVSALSSADGDLVNVLKGNGPFTVFAPVNSAFDDISEVAASLSSSELADVLKYHVVAGANVLSTDLTNGMIVTTLNGTFTVNINGSSVTITDASGATANVIATDVQGTNGVIHVIDKVLLQ